MPGVIRDYEGCLIDISRQRDDVIVLTAENRAAIRGIPAAIGPRFLDLGICEQSMVGAAAGLALRGRVPIVHALATFLTMRAFEFIRTDIGIARLPVKLVGAIPGFLSEANGPTHQALEDISLMRGIPHMHVFCPADIDDLIAALPVIIDHPAPWYIRYCAATPATTHTTPFAVGRAEVFGEGSDVTILTYGFLLREALAAQQMLASRGVHAQVMHLRTLAPIDRDAIVTAARGNACLVTVEDHFYVGGLRTLVAETLLDAGLTARVSSLALRDRWFKPALLPDVLEYEGFTGTHIADHVLHTLTH